jgi:predicted DNA-binding protein with PD1-like motif
MMRSIRHPGPVSPERFAAIACRAGHARLELQPGRSINEAAAQAFAQIGATSGYLRVRRALVAPMRYVIPAISPDGAHAAWYSETFAPRGLTIIEDAGLVVGRRDGEPFVHCHGIWQTPDGQRRMGHLLPLESHFAEPAEADAWAIGGALFDVREDAETNFRLFRAVAHGSKTGRGAPALACTIKPNQDIAEAVEDICRRHGFASATLHGIGSLVEADFVDGSRLGSYATEVLIRSGMVRDGRCTLDIALVGMDGAFREGRLAANVNPVCVTFELLITSD